MRCATSSDELRRLRGFGGGGGDWRGGRVPAVPAEPGLLEGLGAGGSHISICYVAL